MKTALYFKKLKENTVQCELCPNFCLLKNNETGKCRARKNINGNLISLSYGKPIAINIDPIFKKPLYHFLPGSYSYSIGTAGCQLACKNCQNADISQASPDDFKLKSLEPEKIIKAAIKNKCPSISYTYNDFVAFYEYSLDIAKLAKKNKIKNIIVSNGYINEAPLKEFSKYLDAANIDLKSFNDKFYREICSARLNPVLKSLKILKEKNIWLEVTNLIIPTLNDNFSEIEKMCKWIKDNLGEDTPLHFSRFFPMYKLQNLPQTPLETLKRAHEIATKYLNFVYIGNIPFEESTTYCPKCKKLLISRIGFDVTKNNIKNNKCKFCNRKIAGIL